MTRVVMIGIDGLDADLLRVYGPSLPHLRKLMLESPFLELTSCFPPETAPAWASLYTGLHPSDHGIVSSNIQVQPEVRQEALEALREETFWEQASRVGKRVCVVNPLLCYPASSVNGVMLSLPPTYSKYKKECELDITPEDIKLDAPFPAVSSLQVQPAMRHMIAWCQALHEMTKQQAESGLELFRRERWDLFYQQFDTLECIQHVLWQYSDPGDVAYPGRNKHAGRILDFYRLFDTIIGHFRALLEADDVLLVVSAHGHGRRCFYRLNLNEWLHQQNLLVTRPRSIRLLHRHYIADWSRYHARELLARWPEASAVTQLQSSLGGYRRHYSTHLIDQAQTVAQVVALVDNSPYGGLVLNREGIEREGNTCKGVSAMLVQRLRQLRVRGRPVVHWVELREDICQGKYSEYYPDICFELQNEYAIGSAVHVPLLANASIHSASLMAGEHRMHGVCLMSQVPPFMGVQENIKEPSVMDIAPTVLQLLGVQHANAVGRDEQVAAERTTLHNAMLTQ